MLWSSDVFVQDWHVDMSIRPITNYLCLFWTITEYFACGIISSSFFLVFPFLYSFWNAYRAEVATFVAPVAGESASDTRLRERIDFSSNILFFIEDLYLALGPGHVTTKTGSKINVASSLLWVRHQLAGSVKELMIAKKTGWQVLRNLKNEVIICINS